MAMAEGTGQLVDACYWTCSLPPSGHAPFAGEASADVAIIGGGIVGVIAARLLADSGRSVVLLEAGRFGHGSTGRSTAKVTAQHALSLQRIAKQHGEEGARHYADANCAGVELIGQLVGRHALDCSFEPADSFVYATTDDGAAKLEAERDAARSAGLAMDLLPAADELPFTSAGALKLAGQAQFQPAAFVGGLAATLTGTSCQAFENSPVLEWDDSGVRTARGRVRARTTIMATHLPLGQVGQFHAHNAPHMHPILMVPVDAQRAPAGMYISADKPKRSFRRHRDADGRTLMIFTGPTFTHGDPDGETAAFAELEDFAREHFGWAGGGWRWSNEDYTPRDGLPYVGWAGSEGSSPLVATGFDAWGLSNGAAAARMLVDLIEGRANPWATVFAASRHSAKGLGTLIANAASVTADLVRGHLAPDTGPMPTAPGEGGLVKIDGRVAGVFRDDAGALHAVSAVCTHMGCMLGWNPVDRTWDCPCHGSRFGTDGAVRHGPAVEPLAPIKLENG